MHVLGLEKLLELSSFLFCSEATLSAQGLVPQEWPSQCSGTRCSVGIQNGSTRCKSSANHFPFYLSTHVEFSWILSFTSESPWSSFLGSVPTHAITPMGSLDWIYPCLLLSARLFTVWSHSVEETSELQNGGLIHPLFEGNANLGCYASGWQKIPKVNYRCLILFKTFPHGQDKKSWKMEEPFFLSLRTGFFLWFSCWPSSIPACRMWQGCIYFSLAQRGSTGLLSCSEQPHTCVKQDIRLGSGQQQLILVCTTQDGGGIFSPRGGWRDQLVCDQGRPHTGQAISSSSFFFSVSEF